MSQDDERPNAPDERQRPAGGLSSRLGGFGHRPLSVYGVLVIGVATLLLLLAIIYFTATDRNKEQQRVCLTVDAADAVQAIKEGRVDQLTVVVDAGVRTPTNPRFGPVLGRIDYADGQCANLPQGVRGQSDLYYILGVAQIYNQETDGRQVDLRVDRNGDLPAQLFTTPTVPAPTRTPVPPTAPAKSPAATPAGSPAIASPAATPQS